MRSEALLIGWWGKQGRAARYAVLTVAVPVAAAVFITAVSVLGARALVILAVRGAALMWRRAGTYGRLTIAMVLSFPAADIARAAGVLPHWHLVSLVFGAGLASAFGTVLAALKARGRRRWQRGGAMVLRGGWQDCATANAAAIAAGAARIEAVEEQVSAVFEMLAAACANAGIPVTSPTDDTGPILRLVGDGRASRRSPRGA